MCPLGTLWGQRQSRPARAAPTALLFEQHESRITDSCRSPLQRCSAEKLRANTSGASGANNDGSTGNRRSNDGDSRGSNHSNDGSTDENNSRTKLRLEPRYRLRLRR